MPSIVARQWLHGCKVAVTGLPRVSTKSGDADAHSGWRECKSPSLNRCGRNATVTLTGSSGPQHSGMWR